MPTYRYQPGDRPLDGFTLRAPAGRGGFGEVYFAESDAGREVALKALFVSQGYDEIELRGIRHCMNLKSPHLVSIFDVKTGHDGTPFVIMEYVAGPSLRDLLNDSPQGLGTDKAAFFLREVAKGLSHLHGYGVVHRDLKPANIFYEDGYVKIGDYGLSKLMSADPVASQTITVGTVHYMAPEIGAGKYDKSIDLYALGCLLYEMLTGKVPYSGASPTEVLMKHLQAEPELDDVPETFARVIKKALQKDPADRYASATEMVEDLFGADHVRNSVSQLNADELSSIAQRVGQKVVPSPFNSPAPAVASPTPAPHAPPRAAPAPPVTPIAATPRWPHHPGWVFAIGAGLLAVAAAGITQLQTSHDAAFITSFWFLATTGPAVAWAASRMRVFAPAPSFGDRFSAAFSPAIIHIAIGFLAILILAFLGVSGVIGEPLYGVLPITLLPCLFVYWPRHTHAQRPQPFSPGLWVTLGFAAAIPTFVMLPQFFAVSFALPVIIAFGAQILSPPNYRRQVFEAPAPTPPSPLNPAVQAPSGTYSGHEIAPAAVDGPPPAAASATDTSRHSRLAALLLCLSFYVFPIGGLHRFYAGRWITGLLWLCTFGFIGIGQLIDAILIAANHFTDARGRPVSRWGLTPGPNTSGSGSGHTWTPRIAGSSPVLSRVLHIIGALLLILGLAMVSPTLVSLPEALRSAADLGNRQIIKGFDGFPGDEFSVLFRLISLLALPVQLTGVVLICVARRGSLAHLARGFMGSALILGYSSMLVVEPNLRLISDHGVSRLAAELEQSPITPHTIAGVIDQFLQKCLVGDELLLTLFFIFTALVLLLIPAKAKRSTTTPALETQ